MSVEPTSCDTHKNVSHLINKTFTCIFIALFLFSTVAVACGENYYSSANIWGFQNYAYLSFNRVMNFTDPPHLGSTINDSLMAYWSMDEGNGSLVHDYSGNNNNGTIYGATWVTGKYGDALDFGGVNSYVGCGFIVPPAAAITISAWVKSSGTQEESIIGLDSGHRFIYISNGNSLQFWWKTTTSEASRQFSLPSSYLDDAFHLIVFTYDNSTGNARVYWDNQLLGTYFFGGSILPSTDHYQTSIGARFGGTNKIMNGTIDDVRIYNRALGANEVAALFEQPNPTSFANYYNYQDPVTNNTMLIHVDNPNANSNNIVLVTCTNFFAGNRIVFQANNSATVNVWTNLGQPAFIRNGFWNSKNYTTTLTLDASSVSELDWSSYNITTYVDAHSSVSSSNVTVSYEGSQTFSFYASQGYSINVVIDGITMGQISNYTFSNVTAPHTVNVTSVPLEFTIIASSDSGSTISPSGAVSINYGGTQILVIQNKTGYKVTHVWVDRIDQGAISNYTFSNVLSNHGISVTSESTQLTSTSTPTSTPSINPNANQTPTSSQSLEPTNSPSSTPRTQPKTNQFPIQTIAIAMAAIATLMVGFAFALKKGYITIEVLDEETGKSQEEYQDYTI